MRVLHVIPAVAARYGGPSSSLAAMCRALDTLGVETLIASTDADGGARLNVPLGRPTEWDGLDAMFFRCQWSEAFKYSRPLARWLDAHVREFDVVHVHAALSHAPLAAGRAAHRAGVPYIVRPLGTLDGWSLAQKPWRKQLLLTLGGRTLLRRAAAIQYTSAEEQRQVEGALGLSRGSVVPLGVDPALLASAAMTDADRAHDRYVLALSRLHPVKNLEALVDAFADATESGNAQGWRLVIAGSGDEAYAAQLQDRVRRRDVGRVVTLRGWVDGHEKRELMRGASLFALPSFHENFGVALVEALAAGVPAVVSDQVHLASELHEAAAGWTSTPDRSSLAHALTEALTRDDERAARACAARSLAARFTWPTVAADLARLYASLAGSHVSAPTLSGVH